MAITDYYSVMQARTTSQAVDAFGDVTTSLGEPREFRGCVVPLTERQALIMAQRDVAVTARLFAEPTAQLAAFDVITTASGRDYQIVSNPIDHMGRGHHLEADLSELQGGTSDAD